MKFFTPARGFTLVEILVVVSIISILSTAVYSYAKQSSETSRDIKRQSDLRSLQSAVELYKQKNGRYPSGCNGADQWSGETGGGYACTSGSTQYITGLAPEFIPALPRDPKRATAEGYGYVTNALGTVYKIVARGTVESETVTYSHPMRSCDVSVTTTGGGLPADENILVSGFCSRAYISTNTYNYPHLIANHSCNLSVDAFRKSYGVWGGFAPLQDGNDSGSRCIDVNQTGDPLETFVHCTTKAVLSPTAAQKSIIRANAVLDTTNIICK